MPHVSNPRESPPFKVGPGHPKPDCMGAESAVKA